jgi:hypothetical protein
MVVLRAFLACFVLVLAAAQMLGAEDKATAIETWVALERYEPSAEHGIGHGNHAEHADEHGECPDGSCPVHSPVGGLGLLEPIEIVPPAARFAHYTPLQQAERAGPVFLRLRPPRPIDQD